MTAYLMTAEQHAQIVDAMTDGRDWAEDALKDYNDKYDDHPACEGGRKIIADSLERLTAALAMLKAMKPVEPAAWRTIESDEKKPIRLDEWFYASNPDYVKVHKYKWVPLYALGDTA